MAINDGKTKSRSTDTDRFIEQLVENNRQPNLYELIKGIGQPVLSPSETTVERAIKLLNNHEHIRAFFGAYVNEVYQTDPKITSFIGKKEAVERSAFSITASLEKLGVTPDVRKEWEDVIQEGLHSTTFIEDHNGSVQHFLRNPRSLF